MKWTPERIAQLRELAPRMGSAAIGERLGIASTAVLKKAHKLGLSVSRRSEGAPYWPDHVDELRALAASGVGWKAVAKRFGVSHSAIRKQAHKFQIRIRMTPPPDPRSEDDKLRDRWAKELPGMKARLRAEVRAIMAGALAAPILLLLAGSAHAAAACTNASLSGPLAFTISGEYALAMGKPLDQQVSGAGLLVADGAGGFTGTLTGSIGTKVYRGVGITGSYTVTSACTGTISLWGTGLPMDIFLGAKGILGIDTESNTHILFSAAQ